MGLRQATAQSDTAAAQAQHQGLGIQGPLPQDQLAQACLVLQLQRDGAAHGLSQDLKDRAERLCMKGQRSAECCMLSETDASSLACCALELSRAAAEVQQACQDISWTLHDMHLPCACNFLSANGPCCAAILLEQCSTALATSKIPCFV